MSLFYESRYNNEAVCVFVGRDDTGTGRFACVRGIAGNLKKDISGSDKRFSFCYPPDQPGSRHLAVFEAPIDALSHATLQKLEGWQWNGYRLSLGGTSSVALVAFLERHPEITRVALYLDNDLAGRVNARKIKTLLKSDQRFSKIRVSVNPPRSGKDYNEKLQRTLQAIREEKHASRQKHRQNGRDKAWKVKFIGVGNESWGCGGSMRPEYYADLYRRYSTYCRNYDGNRLFKIASGASDYDYNWTETLMKNVGGRMDGISLHYYTVTGWNGSKGSATNFNKDDYYWTMGKCLEIEDVVRKHIQIMDKYDPQKKIGLMVDEWGTWWDEEPGTINGHLYQQNTMRDAFVAALTLNVFHKYTDRVRMTNIAQIVNVLQSMILTNGPKMLLTPTYYVFQMYNVHQDATFLPMDLICDKAKVRGGREVPMVSASASKDKNGRIHISLANVDVDNAQSITLDLQGQKIGSVKGRILTSASINDHNTFEKPDVVKPATFDGAKIEKGQLKIDLPAKSIVVLEVK